MAKEIFVAILERTLAVLCLVLTSPFLLILPVLIRFETDGPGFFIQARMGKGHRIFMIIKFRTMVDGAVIKGAGLTTVANDSRITRIGFFLRRTGLDRIPQLINVARGEMCFIGPKALLPAVCLDSDCRRWEYKPGMFYPPFFLEKEFFSRKGLEAWRLLLQPEEPQDLEMTQRIPGKSA